MARRKISTTDNQPAPTSPSLRERVAAVDPLVLAAAGVAVGAVAGALLPRSEAEARLLAPIGPHVSAAAVTLGRALRQAVSAELAAVPIVGPMVVEQIDRVIDELPEPA